MDLELRGATAVITGSTAGIGFAIAERLAREGAKVVISGRTQERVDDARAVLAKKVPHAEVAGVAADLGTVAGCVALIGAAPEADILVNNVGIFTVRPFEAIADDDWHAAFDTNVLSGARLSRHYLPRMLNHNRGRIIFISSESALQIPAEMIHYGVSKAAQAALARGLAELTRGTKVTVNTVLAGPTKSEGVGTFVADLARQQQKSEADVEAEFFQSARPTSLVQRFLSPEEIADVVAFVASERASAISGAALRAEGGVLKTAF